MQTQTQPTVTNAKRAIAKSAEGYPLLGQVVYWEMEDINISKMDFVAALNSVGIDPTKHLRDIRFKSIVNRAIKAAVKDRGDNRIRVQKALDNDEKTVWAVFFIDLDASGDVSLQTENKIVLTKANESVSITGPDEAEIRRYINDLGGVYRTEDFRKFVLNYMKKTCSIVSIRSRGGVYFVPSTRDEDFQKIAALFNEMRGCDISFIPVIDTGNAKNSLWQKIVQGKLEELEALKESIEAMDSKDYLFERRMNELLTLKNEVSMYHELFSMTAENFASKLSQCETALANKMKI